MTVLRASFLALVVAILSCGGGGLQPDPSAPAVPLEVPIDLARRTVITNALVEPEGLDGWVGHVIEIGNPQQGIRCSGEPTGPPSLRRYLVPVDLRTKPLSQILFQAVIDRSASAEFGYLPFAASLGDSMRQEVIVEDIARQIAPQEAILFRALDSLRNTPKAPGVCGRFFIHTVHLTSVKYRTFSRVQGQAKVAGPALSAGGNWYRATTDFRQQLFLSLDYRSLDGYSSAIERADSMEIGMDTLTGVRMTVGTPSDPFRHEYPRLGERWGEILLRGPQVMNIAPLTGARPPTGP